MTDVLERAPRPETDAPPSGPIRVRPAPAVPLDLAAPGRAVLAALSAAAGAIHLAMVPSHMDSSAVEGIGFALAGWFQVVVAVVLLTRPTRPWIRVAMLATVGFLGVWVVSRVWGLPVGEHSGHPHEAAFVDLAAVGLEVGFLVAAGVLLSRPRLGAGWSRRSLALGAVLPLAVLGLGTAAIASPSARDHADSAHGVHGGHGAPDGAAGAAAGATGHGHDEATAADDKGLSKLQNGHQHEFGEVPLDRATQVALTQQLNQTRRLVEKYPTVAVAEAAGYRRAGPFSPGLGAHYGGFGSRAFAEDQIQGVDGPMTPMLIFDGTDPDSPLAGFMFLSLRGGGAPEGFVGPNDHWHYHTNACIVVRNGVIEAPLGADRDITLADCRAVGGSLIQTTSYMVHVWTVPGYESPNGVFSEINPKITCPDGTYHTVRDKVDFRINRCRSAAA